ncbi:CGNR zinc finger domain-containing protein [Streptomyces puniciscabiei]
MGEGEHHPRLAWTADGPHRADLPDTGNPAAAALSQLAEDATGLLTGADTGRLTECAAQGCARWFLRSHGARRWCTVKCGNRVRACSSSPGCRALPRVSRLSSRFTYRTRPTWRRFLLFPLSGPLVAPAAATPVTFALSRWAVPPGRIA